MRIATDSSQLRSQLASWRAAGETIALIPTMGALHAGHLSLFSLASGKASRVVVSVFVNPTQFAPGEDFAAYPRTWESDLQQLTAVGADLVFRPSVADLYPPGFATTVTVAGPAAVGLDDKFRPTHFAGIATVVTKLLLLAQPDVAAFGEKDYQQLAVIRQLARDLGLPVEILSGPTVRAADGLALSSRNAYLSDEERCRAPALHRALTETAARLLAGMNREEALDLGRRSLEAAGFAVDYFELRDARTLAAPTAARNLRLLTAARIGRTRLIDNVAVGDAVEDGTVR